MVDNTIYKNDIHHGVVKKGAELDLDCFFVREADFSKFQELWQDRKDAFGFRAVFAGCTDLRAGAKEMR